MHFWRRLIDRTFAYNGAVPDNRDILRVGFNAYLGFGNALLDILGSTSVASGFACTATAPASMQVAIGTGRLYSVQPADSVAFGDLGTDTTDNIVKQGTLRAPVNLTCAAPGIAGFSLNYLIEASFSQSDSDIAVIPYYNAANPQVSWSGPNNTGTAQATRRIDGVSLQAKAGIAAATGTQVTPAADAGCVPLYVVTVTFGQTTITSSNISVAPTAPFLPVTLPNALSAPIADARYVALYGLTNAEKYAIANFGVTGPVSFQYPPSDSRRFGVDPTGSVDSTAAFNNWIACSAWAMYAYTDGQGLWNGNGGASPVLQLQPGKYMVSGTIFMPPGMTLKGTGHPANTTSHTRIIMTSTQNAMHPGRTWTAGAKIPPGAKIDAGNGYWFSTMLGGTSGSTTPGWTTSSGAGTVTDGTVTWTFGAANTTGDNRNIPMFMLGRGNQPRTAATTSTGGGNGSITDPAAVVTIQELECWYVTPGTSSSFSNPLNGNGYAVDDYPMGAILYIDVDTADCRAVDCVFQGAPCSVRGLNVTGTANRGDGFPGSNRGIGFIFENCEFDASACHLNFQNCALDLAFRGCTFFNTASFYGAGCTGNVVYHPGCRFEDGGTIKAPMIDAGLFYGANAFAAFNVKGCHIEAPANFPFIYLNSPANGGYVGAYVDISDNSFPTAATVGGVTVIGATSGAIKGNIFNNQGFNGVAGTGPTDFVAVINAQYTYNLAITGNSIANNNVPMNGFLGFGIFTYGGSGNLIQGNHVTTNFAGGLYRGRHRHINVAATDFLGPNHDASISADSAAGSLVLLGSLGVNGVPPPAQSTGWGAPTGGNAIANFNATTATNSQMQQAIAKLIAIAIAKGDAAA